MATFEGTAQELKRYIGPHLRNIVQQLTKKQKATVGACEHCGSSENLEAAHVRGKGRTDIINLLLKTGDRDAVRVDLKGFETAFKAEHEPLEKAILILCRDCHQRYDSGQVKRGRPAHARVIAEDKGRSATTPVESEYLPITLEPSQVSDFKARLLHRKAAEITISFSDGHTESRPWDASRFAETSNVFGNLRSRPEFRQGEWKKRGIVKVHVRVLENA